MRSCTVLFGDLQMFLAGIFGIKNDIYEINSVIYDYVRSHTVSVDYVRSYTIIEGVCVLAPQHTSLLMDRIYVLFQKDTLAQTLTSIAHATALLLWWCSLYYKEYINMITGCVPD